MTIHAPALRRLSPRKDGMRAQRRIRESHGLLHRLRCLPLAVRLACLFGFLVAATLLVVASVTLVIARSHLERTLDSELRASAQSFRRGPAASAHDAVTLRQATRRWLAERPLPESQMAAIRLAGGAVLTSAGGLDLFEISHPHRLLMASEAGWWQIEGSDGPVRGLTVPIVRGDRQLGTLVLLAYEQPVYETLAALLSGIALASGIGLALALLLGMLAVRRSLRPLTRMTATVVAIEDTGDLSPRVSLGGETAEVAQLADAFDRMLAKLEEAFEAQRRFLADASHELRTPLTVVRGQLEMLTDDLEANADGAFSVATGELDRMARIIDDLLLLARLDEGMELRCEPVEVELVLREALLRALLLAPRDVRVDAQPSVYALADGERLLQVVTNLVTNAVHHTDETGKIVLSAQPQNGTVEVAIADTGPGIQPTDLPHVFERFYRGAKERGSAPEGSGLGLAIASSLVTAMNGTIDVRSTDRLGTTFFVRLPAASNAPELTTP
jgi:two-component system OmpR family sensor kinase